MSNKLFYDDPYTTTFDAEIVEHVRVGDRLAIVLDQTCFYPTSGGQPCDEGQINDIPVVDVSIREDDGAIIHLMADEIWVDHVHGEINWARRFDHMQQHTGQHVLSAAFVKVTGAETIGFHIGIESCTIDLNVADLAPAQVERVENLANEVVFANRWVRTSTLSPEQVARLPLRKPLQVDGPIRIVEVEKFDLSACGGTHVRHAGEIGITKIIRVETRGKELRIHFRCGWRALGDYRLKNDLIINVANQFSIGQWEVGDAVERLRKEARLLRSEVRRANARLLEYEAKNLYNSAERQNRLRVVSAVFSNRDRKELNWLAKTLTEKPDVIVLFGVAGSSSHILFARSQDVDRDMVLLLKTALRVLGSTSGGGRPEVAQGGGPPADEKRVRQAIDRAKRLLLAQR